jgi:hypothetical protein
MGRVRVTSNVRTWARNTVNVTLDRAVAQMATDIHRESMIFAPKDTRALVKSARVEREGVAHYLVSYNTPYARRRHFENQRNPQTLGYLERAGERAVRNIKRYIRNA